MQATGLLLTLAIFLAEVWPPPPTIVSTPDPVFVTLFKLFTEASIFQGYPRLLSRSSKEKVDIISYKSTIIYTA